MAIPAFDRNGNLPPGVHHCDASEFKDVFVTPFPDSRTRPDICNGLFKLQSDAKRHGLHCHQWIDGSFVTSKLDPNDVNLTTFCDYDLVNRLSPVVQLFLDEVLAGGEESKAGYHCHSFLVLACQPGHPAYDLYTESRKYWRKWWARDRQGREKGLVSMTVGDPALAPDVPV